MSTNEQEPKEVPKGTLLTKVSISRFSFFMKAIAENDLWDEVHEHLESLGYRELLVAAEPIKAVQELLKRKSKEVIS